jgi:hypothetical protein
VARRSPFLNASFRTTNLLKDHGRFSRTKVNLVELVKIIQELAERWSNNGSPLRRQGETHEIREFLN